VNTLTTAQVRRENLGRVVAERGSQAALAALLEVTPGYLNQLMLGRRNIGEKTARKIEAATGKPGGWMDQRHDGSGEASAHSNVTPGPETRGYVPLISWVQAGAWGEAVDLYAPGDGEDWLPCPTSHGPRTFALRVDGDSMTAAYGKSYPAGCIIYVDPDQRGGVVSGDRVVAKLKGSAQVTFKVFVEDAGRRFLKPLNTQYPVIDEPFGVIGKVIGKWESE
jgi:SOS-response transcriptional repressor LexA